ncbi:MAG: hypothetical protein KY467_08515 [Gemmatimonadetes bacterium]|nr:hypothetical protein [Gemmatimonadota bacterium]
MRAGMLLMAATALIGGLTMVIIPRDPDGDRDARRGDGVEQSLAAVPAAAAPADTAARAASFACRVDTSGVALPGAVHESSGLALSGGGDALWTHNDSGEPRLHLVGADGTARGQVRVAGATVTDWEDVSAGPCPGGGRCLYVADIGDNQASRPGIAIYRVPEPGPGDAQTRPADALLAEYPDGPHDAEAMFVLPDGGVHVVTKGETGHVAVYRLPRTARPGTRATLERVAELRTGNVPRRERVTGAAAAPDGQWIVLRTLDALSFYRAGDLATGRLAQPLTYDLKPLDEKQGEGVEFGPGGTVFLSSEGGKKENPATLARLTCTLPG